MNRDELVAAGAKALSDGWRRGIVFTQDDQGRWHTDYGKLATVMLDVVEPLVRADEQERCEADERIAAWEAVAAHPTLRHAYDVEGPLLPAVIQLLSGLGRMRADLRTRIDAAPTPVEDGSAYADGWHDAVIMVLGLLRTGAGEPGGQ